jgi:hypothetical protein
MPVVLSAKWANEKLQQKRRQEAKAETLEHFYELRRSVLPTESTEESRTEFDQTYGVPFFTNYCFNEAKERYQECLKPALYELEGPQGTQGWTYSANFKKLRHTLFETQADKAKPMLNIAARQFVLLCRNVSEGGGSGWEAKSRAAVKYTNELLWWQKQFSESTENYLVVQTADMKHHTHSWAGG